MLKAMELPRLGAAEASLWLCLISIRCWRQSAKPHITITIMKLLVINLQCDHVYCFQCLICADEIHLENELNYEIEKD